MITRRNIVQLAGPVVAGGLTTTPALAAGADIVVKRLRVEWWDRALGVGVLRPRLHWTLGAAGKKRGLGQSAFRVVILTDDTSRRIISDTGRLPGVALRFQPESDLPLRPQSKYVAQLTVWDQAGRAAPPHQLRFATGLLSPGDNRAKWISGERDNPGSPAGTAAQPMPVESVKPLPLFRRPFNLEKKPVGAHVAVVGLGQYQLYLDGRKITPDGLNGHWTNYDRRVAYDCYDLAAHLGIGPHALSVALGNGFFNVEPIAGRYTKLNRRSGPPQMWLQLRLTYADGSEEFIVSDERWQVRDSGTRLSSIFAGEDFDARLDNDRAWRAAEVIRGPAGPLEAARFAPMQAQRRLSPKSMKTLASGAVVYDMGLNHSGRPEITLRNTRPGQVIRIVPSELVSEDGAADQLSMVGGSTQGYRGIAFTYTCKGGRSETWQPQFTYTGYRYLQVEGIASASIARLESLFLYDRVNEVGTFRCTDRNMEAIHGLIKQALLSNLASVITDCPHREKLGWLEQIYLNAATAMMNVDAVAIYEKMTADMRDAQTPTGMVPSIAPEFTAFLDGAGKDTAFRDSPEWGAALILATWYAFRLYGDPGILEENYAGMRARIAYMQTRVGPDGLVNYGLGDWYDIGPRNPGPAQLTSLKMTGTATFFLELKTMAEIAVRLGRTDAAQYRERAEALKATMQRALFNPATSRFDTGSQTAQAMAIVLDLLPQGHLQAALKVLVEDIRSRGYQVTAGDIGFHYVVRALSDNGHADVLHAMLSRTGKPSYLDQINKGATALTEAWDARRDSSHNHFMLGHAELWLWSGLGGINVDFSATERLTIAPQVVEGVDGTFATYESVFGTIRSGLSRRGRTITVDVEAPVGATALVRIPCRSLDQILEGGKPVGQAAGVTGISHADGVASLRVGSGAYRFAVLAS